MHEKELTYPLADFTTDSRVIILSGMAIVIGLMSAFAASILLWMISVISNLCYFGEFSSQNRIISGHHLGYLAIAIPILGGLIIGLMARYGSEKIRGHGIPEAIEAILIGKSQMDPKVAVLKPISSAISIGTGGPFGAEGPIIMTGGAFGSLFAQLFHLSSAERKTLLVAGAAGGMSAVFASPMAAVLLAVELLLFEWKPRSLIPVGIASIVAFGMRVFLLGPGPIFPIKTHELPHFPILIVAFVVGMLNGVGSACLTWLVYTFEDLFQKIPLHWMWWPAIGGFFVGIGGYFQPQVLGVGYDVIHQLLKGEVVGSVLFGLCVGKALIWSIALGSGTSGGVLAPLLMIGGFIGAIIAPWIPFGDASLWSTLAMASMMGGTMRSPLTASIFALELTQDYDLLPTLLSASVGSYLVSVLIMKRSILTEKLDRRGHHLIREYSVDVFHTKRASEVMEAHFGMVPEETKITDLADRLYYGDPFLTQHNALLIVNSDHEAVGIITRGDVLKVMQSDFDEDMTVLQAGSNQLITAYPDTLLSEVISLMHRHKIGRIPIVKREQPKQVIGYLGRAEILKARSHQIHEETQRESRWHAF